ncbi:MULTISPECIES: hypothetical protein [unclassified Serratia (in: enterobacteria)]|uniref:hypothetical protein n=1 Tax=unclassified Serratia (in: enterobacteria) TaxID=2647522 RepID=UPI003076265F
MTAFYGLPFKEPLSAALESAPVKYSQTKHELKQTHEAKLTTCTTPGTVAIGGYSFTVYFVLVVVVLVAEMPSLSPPWFSATKPHAAATATAPTPVATALPFAPRATKGAPQELEAPSKASATNAGHNTFFIQNPLVVINQVLKQHFLKLTVHPSDLPS